MEQEAAKTADNLEYPGTAEQLAVDLDQFMYDYAKAKELILCTYFEEKCALGVKKC